MACLLPQQARAQAPPTSDLLRDRATAYVEDFISRFSDVVAEERFLLQSASLPNVNGSGFGARIDLAAPDRREIRSDFLLIRRRTTDDWLVYRDAFEVDGRAVRDRGDRLVKLLTTPSLENDDLVRQVALENARYDLDPGLRSVENPLLSLVFLQTAFRDRFRFTRGEPDDKVGQDVWVLNYQEQQRPTIVRGLRDTDSPARGRVWIDASTGRVLRAEVAVRGSRTLTTFAWDETLQVAVPVELRDAYRVGRTGFTVTSTYSRFRRFGVSTSEVIK